MKEEEDDEEEKYVDLDEDGRPIKLVSLFKEDHEEVSNESFAIKLHIYSVKCFLNQIIC